MDAESTETQQPPLRIFTWRGFGLAWDGEEKPVETRQIVAAVSQQQAMSICASWMVYSCMVETLPPESFDPEHRAVAMLKPGAIFWACSGMAEWQELTKETPRLPPSARGPVQPVTVPRAEDPVDAAMFQKVRDALYAAETSVSGTAKLEVMEALGQLAQLEERMRQMRGAAVPFLEVAQDRIARRCYEPIPLEACRALLGIHRHQVQRS
jgi:hypothetical protein